MFHELLYRCPMFQQQQLFLRFSSIRSAILFKIFERSETEVLPQASFAACAASSASSISSAVERATCVNTFTCYWCNIIKVLTFYWWCPFAVNIIFILSLKVTYRTFCIWKCINHSEIPPHGSICMLKLKSITTHSCFNLRCKRFQNYLNKNSFINSFCQKMQIISTNMTIEFEFIIKK